MQIFKNSNFLWNDQVSSFKKIIDAIKDAGEMVHTSKFLIFKIGTNLQRGKCSQDIKEVFLSEDFLKIVFHNTGKIYDKK